jgi:hypothetical protein
MIEGSPEKEMALGRFVYAFRRATSSRLGLGLTNLSMMPSFQGLGHERKPGFPVWEITQLASRSFGRAKLRPFSWRFQDEMMNL